VGFVFSEKFCVPFEFVIAGRITATSAVRWKKFCKFPLFQCRTSALQNRENLYCLTLGRGHMYRTIMMPIWYNISYRMSFD